ncbi:oxidoreductase, NAD-binding Rossmann fold family protein [Schleiferilactobacillus harbinensis DSM 16991]|uniref:Oxidoreductase, NAD-binding Rossmann fold family protein n=2 Tax=Schleiferilactobacillus harbinensis TaxID=304207 RepID=A0A0R1X7X3_9LACO|nr:oxidoreductase, NAD-binding Rossmann fold family protein [Schleiferilactobacillus harbinensis DSM 16991]
MYPKNIAFSLKESKLMTNNLNVVILGLGGIAHAFAQDAANVAGTTLYGAASRALPKAQEFADQYHIPHAYGSYEDAIADAAVDAVYIATPHRFHFSEIMAALRAGKHVLSEKAIVMSSHELRQVSALAKKQNKVVMEAQTIYHMPLYAQLRAMQQADVFGDIRVIDVMFGSNNSNTDPNSRLLDPQLAGGALLDIGVYALSAARMFQPDAPQLLNTTMKMGPTSVDDRSVASFTNNYGILTNVSLSFYGRLPKQISVATTKGMLTIMDYPRAQAAVFTDINRKATTITTGETNKAMAYELADFAEACQNPSAHRDDWQWTTEVMDAMTAIRRSWGYLYPFEDNSAFQQ